MDHETVQKVGRHEIAVAIIPRKVLTPNDVADCPAVVRRLRACAQRSNAQPKPCGGRVTRADRERRRLERGGPAPLISPAA